MNEWPNHMGYTVETEGGEWDIWYPDPLANRNQYAANFIPSGESYVAEHGTGPNAATAMMNAQPIAKS